MGGRPKIEKAPQPKQEPRTESKRIIGIERFRIGSCNGHQYYVTSSLQQFYWVAPTSDGKRIEFTFRVATEKDTIPRDVNWVRLSRHIDAGRGETVEYQVCRSATGMIYKVERRSGRMALVDFVGKVQLTTKYYIYTGKKEVKPHG